MLSLSASTPPSTGARGRIADVVEAAIPDGEQEQPVAGGVDLELKVGTAICETEDSRTTLGGSGACPEVEGVEGGAGDVAGGADLAAADEERERRLALVAGEEEIGAGGEAAPGTADRAAAEERLRRQADEDLPHDELLREGRGGRAGAPRPSRSGGCPHGPRTALRDLS